MSGGIRRKCGLWPVWRGASLTEYGDVDAGGVALVLDDVMNVADIVSTLGHSGTGEEVAGARLHGKEVVRQRLHVDHLEGGQTEVVIQHDGKILKLICNCVIIQIQNRRL